MTKNSEQSMPDVFWRIVNFDFATVARTVAYLRKVPAKPATRVSENDIDCIAYMLVHTLIGQVSKQSPERTTFLDRLKRLEAITWNAGIKDNKYIFTEVPHGDGMKAFNEFVDRQPPSYLPDNRARFHISYSQKDNVIRNVSFNVIEQKPGDDAVRSALLLAAYSPNGIRFHVEVHTENQPLVLLPFDDNLAEISKKYPDALAALKRPVKKTPTNKPRRSPG